jgi:hypothetical protein
MESLYDDVVAPCSVVADEVCYRTEYLLMIDSFDFS